MFSVCRNAGGYNLLLFYCNTKVIIIKIKKDSSKMRKFYIKLFSALILFLALNSVPLYAVPYSLQGKVIDGSTQKPVSFAIVIIQEAGLVSNAPQGNYYIEIPKSGRFTVKVQSPGLESIITSVTVEGNVTRNFTLSPFTSKGSGVVIKGEKDIQKISRHTMSKKEIKEVPASFGDSLNALTALPSVSRPGGIFGPLVIRGADPAVNGYFIDDIPLFNPMHFGGLHSIINNDLMREIDLYSSSYPSQFSNAQGAIININTIDEVTESGGNVDVGLISACALYKEPIKIKSIDADGKEKSENKGYIITSARIGYLSLFIPLFYKYVMDQELDQVADYWDYQFKAKYFLDKDNSISILAFGSKDVVKLILKDKYMDPRDDPFFLNATVRQNQQSHNLGVYYTFKPKESFSNTLLGYGAMTNYYLFEDLPSVLVDWAHNLKITNRPYIFGLKDKLRFEWWKSHADLKAGVEFNYYRFNVDGIRFIQNKGGEIDFSDPTQFTIGKINKTIMNKTLVHYMENKFTFGWINFVPGYHSEYLAESDKQTFDPRGALSFVFPTGTTLGAAGGYYSCFLQTNGTYFNTSPDYAEADYLDPQRSIHRALSLEQKVSDYTFKVEGFNNNFWDIVYQEDKDGDGPGLARFYNGGKRKTSGFELMAKISDESEQGLFGWASYTYSKTKYKSAESTNIYGDKWLHSDFEQPHVVKLVTGYTYKKHTLSAKFQMNSSTPYTPITGDEGFITLPNGKVRYSPVYGKTNTARLAPSHELDIRYSYKTNYKWGYVTWYIEVINADNYQGEEYIYDYRSGYSSSNPVIEKATGMAFLPNFGVEAKF